MDVLSIQTIAWERWFLKLTRTGNEFHSGCPFCPDRGTDRFIIWMEHGNYYCRHCGAKGWLLENKKDFKLDPALRKTEEQKLAAMEQRRIQHLAEWQSIYNEGYVAGYHAAMTEAQRNYWRSEGIPDEVQDVYGLGYTPKKKIKTEQGDLLLPAYTIPIHHPATQALVNIQYRLVNPPEGIGKYRQEHDIPAASFYADSRLEGEALVVEGAKKAIVMYITLECSMPVIGLPSNCPSPLLLEDLRVFENLYLCLDPNSDKQIERIGKVLGKAIRVVSLGVKPDDAVVKFGLTQAVLRKYLKMSRHIV